MAKKKKGKQVRANFRKRQNTRVRKRDFTREFEADAEQLGDQTNAERVSGKGKLTRKRTVSGADAKTGASGFEVELEVDENKSFQGRVLRVHGLSSYVSDAEGTIWNCTVRGVLKSLATDLQHVVVAGDYVTASVFEGGDSDQAVIIRVEPRRNQICRTSRKRQQIIVSNIDLAMIVASASEPNLKPNLIDRFLVTAEHAGITPVILINKVDLVDAADLQPAVGVWSQMGYRVILTSTVSGRGVDELRRIVAGKDCVVTGQSGVGKSSILNAIEPGLGLRVSNVSEENQKGRHTTTTAQLIPLSNTLPAAERKSDWGFQLQFDAATAARSHSRVPVPEAGDDDEISPLHRRGHLIDTPGIRQMQLWDVVAEEVDGLFRDLRPFVNDCRFPDCSHTHEDDCAIKWAVADGRIDARRYESYCSIRFSDDD